MITIGDILDPRPKLQIMSELIGEDMDNNSTPVCICGCNTPASWLCSGFDYDPMGLFERGKPYKDEPSCDAYKDYLEQSSLHLGLPFEKTRVIP